MVLQTKLSLFSLLGSLWLLSPKAKKAIHAMTTGLPEATIGEAVRALEHTKDEQDRLIDAAIARDSTFPERLSAFLKSTFADIKRKAEAEEQASIGSILPKIDA